jgi:hypothetical protein
MKDRNCVDPNYAEEQSRDSGRDGCTAYYLDDPAPYAFHA